MLLVVGKAKTFNGKLKNDMNYYFNYQTTQLRYQRRILFKDENTMELKVRVAYKCNKKVLQELISNIQKWSIDKELHEADPIKQTVKLVEELGELASGLLKDKKEVIVDSLGDMLVVIIILHQQLGLTMEETLEFAWNEIKDRKGEMKNGVLVKEVDL